MLWVKWRVRRGSGRGGRLPWMLTASRSVISLLMCRIIDLQLGGLIPLKKQKASVCLSAFVHFTQTWLINVSAIHSIPEVNRNATRKCMFLIFYSHIFPMARSILSCTKWCYICMHHWFIFSCFSFPVGKCCWTFEDFANSGWVNLEAACWYAVFFCSTLLSPASDLPSFYFT